MNTVHAKQVALKTTPPDKKPETLYLKKPDDRNIPFDMCGGKSGNPSLENVLLSEMYLNLKRPIEHAELLVRSLSNKNFLNPY